MTSGQPWRFPADAVYVWRAPLDRPADEIEQLAAVLSPDERQRAARFRFEHLTRRFIVARGAMRQILASYLRVDAASLTFEYGPQGKPSLRGPAADAGAADAGAADAGAADGLTFNLSHSGELALLAVSLGRAVGVDVEALRPLTDAIAIAERFFCPAERAAIVAAHPDERPGYFYRFWTRKEALLKATGHGLSLPLDCVDVSEVPGSPATVVSVLDGARAARALALLDLDPAAGYAGALAVEGEGWRLACRDWPADVRTSAEKAPDGRRNDAPAQDDERRVRTPEPEHCQ